ncbi:MAG: DUF4388 domain-containing protein [bacterium]
MSDPALSGMQLRVDMGALKGVRLTSADGLVLSLVDGSRTVDAIVKSAPLPRDQVLAAVTRLRDAGVLLAPGESARRAPPAAAPPQARHTRPPGANAEVPFVEVKTDEVVANPATWVKDAIRAGAEPGHDPTPSAVKRQAEVEAEFLERLDLDGAPEGEPVPAPMPARRKRAAPWQPKGKVETGSLKNEPIYRLLRDYYNDKRTGLLRIETDKDWRELYLFRGHPNYVREPNPKYKFGESLERSGLVSPGDIAEAQKIAQKENLLLGLVLVELGSLTEFQIKGIVRTLVEVRISDVFGWDRGTYTFTADDRERDDLVLTQIDMSRVLFFGLKTKFPWEKARLELERDQDRYVVHNPDMVQAVQRLKLADRERRFLDGVIDGSRTLRQIIGYSTLKGSSTWQLMHALVVTGIVKFQENAKMDVVSSKAALDVDKKMGTLRGATHFDVLEVHWTALDHEIQSSYERLRREYALERREIQAASQETRDKTREVLDRIELAYRSVQTAEARRKYRDTVIPADKIKFAATFNVQQAKNFKFMGDLRQAKECFERARELIPGMKVDF